MAPSNHNYNGTIQFDWSKVMEKNGEIKEGQTPSECCGKPDACTKEATTLEDHLTKRAADKASDCCKDQDKCC
jgi:hypothetical protein